MTVKFRRFSQTDNIKVCGVFARSIGDLLARSGNQPLVDLDDPQDWGLFWDKRRFVFDHLARTGEGWLAEIDQQIVGYARSTLRDGLRQLTEFFVLPQAQGQGVGSGLLHNVFPSEEDRCRLVVATTDASAVMRYTKSGVYVQSVVFDFEKTPQPRQVETELVFVRLTTDQRTLEELNIIDRQILGHTRDVDHRWLISNRSGFLCRRDGHAVGYGYVGEDSGPFALLSPDDFPVLLDYAENLAATLGVDEFWLMVPLVNHTVMDYVAAGGYEMDYRFPMLCMTDEPRVQLDRYIMTLPGFFI